MKVFKKCNAQVGYVIIIFFCLAALGACIYGAENLVNDTWVPAVVTAKTLETTDKVLPDNRVVKVMVIEKQSGEQHTVLQPYNTDTYICNYATGHNGWWNEEHQYFGVGCVNSALGWFIFGFCLLWVATYIFLTVGWYNFKEHNW